MKPRIAPTSALLALAERQGGCLTVEQCHDHGLSRRVVARLKTTAWTPLTHGIYCVREPDWLAMAWTGILVGGDESVVGSHAAAFLDGMVAAPPPRITVWTPRRVARDVPWAITFRKGRRRGHGSPPRTWPELSVLDAAGECSADELVALVASAFTSGRVRPEMLVKALQTRSRQAHRDALLDMCTTLPGVESVLESRFVRDVARAHGLPEGTRQVWLGHTRVDCLIAEYGLIIELDGRAHHEHRRFRDMGRDNANLVDRGLVTLRYGWHDVASRPCSVARQLASLLRRRGWTGTLKPCTRCAH